MIHIFYHKSDLDGHASGAITNYYYNINGKQTVLHPINYNEKIPWDKLNGDIILVDFHLHQDEFEYLDKIFVIDHHESFLKELNGRKFNGIVEIGKAACELCWNYFFPEKPIPRWLWYLSRYDIWDENNPKWDNEILPFQYRLKAEITDPLENFEFWLPFLNNSVDEDKLIKEGEIIIRYQRAMNQKAMTLYSFEAEFEGYKAICLNTTLSNSQVFESKWNPAKYDIMIRFIYINGKYEVSLYSPKIDVSQLASQYGGGGHKGAAGFISNNLEFLKCSK